MALEGEAAERKDRSNRLADSVAQLNVIASAKGTEPFHWTYSEVSPLRTYVRGIINLTTEVAPQLIRYVDGPTIYDAIGQEVRKKPPIPHLRPGALHAVLREYGATDYSRQLVDRVLDRTP